MSRSLRSSKLPEDKFCKLNDQSKPVDSKGNILSGVSLSSNQQDLEDTAQSGRKLIGYSRRKKTPAMAATTLVWADFENAWNNICAPTTLGPLITAVGEFDASKFDFNGFDAKKIFMKMVGVKETTKVSDVEFVRDIMDIVSIGLSRGNIRQDQLVRTVDGGGADRIQALATRYSIPMRAARGGAIVRAGDTLTFSRSLAVFPHFASWFLFKEPSLARNVYHTLLGTRDLPTCMQHPGFSALIPNGINPMAQSAFLIAHTAFMTEFSMTINPGLKSQEANEVRALFSSQKNFQKVAKENSLYKEEHRVMFFVTWQLNTREEFSKVLRIVSRVNTMVGKNPLSDTYGAECFSSTTNTLTFGAPHDAGMAALTTNANNMNAMLKITMGSRAITPGASSSGPVATNTNTSSSDVIDFDKI